eukprot:4734206-Amphidinium_carterae.1
MAIVADTFAGKTSATVRLRGRDFGGFVSWGQFHLCEATAYSYTVVASSWSLFHQFRPFPIVVDNVTLVLLGGEPFRTLSSLILKKALKPLAAGIAVSQVMRDVEHLDSKEECCGTCPCNAVNSQITAIGTIQMSVCAAVHVAPNPEIPRVHHRRPLANCELQGLCGFVSASFDQITCQSRLRGPWRSQ